MRSVIEEIAAAEQRAEEIRLAAAADSRELVLKAREEAQRALAQMEEQERDSTQSGMASAQAEGERLSAEMNIRMQKEADELCARAESRLDKAVSYLVDKVIKTA